MSDDAAIREHCLWLDVDMSFFLCIGHKGFFPIGGTVTVTPFRHSGNESTIIVTVKHGFCAGVLHLFPSTLERLSGLTCPGGVAVFFNGGSIAKKIETREHR